MAITLQILECWGDILELLDLLLVDFDNLSRQEGLESHLYSGYMWQSQTAKGLQFQLRAPICSVAGRVRLSSHCRS